MSGGGNLPIGPGIWGFIAFFVLALALWFLVRNMNSRLRRMAYRDRDRAEEFAADADVAGTKGDRATAAGPDPDAHPAAGERGDDPHAGDDPHPGDDPDQNGEGPRP
jgi:hypothetical protein